MFDKILKIKPNKFQEYIIDAYANSSLGYMQAPRRAGASASLLMLSLADFIPFLDEKNNRVCYNVIGNNKIAIVSTTYCQKRYTKDNFQNMIDIKNASANGMNVTFHHDRIHLKHIGGELDIMFFSASEKDRMKGNQYEAVYFDNVATEEMKEIIPRGKKVFSISSIES